MTLILSLSLLTGCKSAKVKAVEETIKAIGTVAIDSGDSMAAAEDLYHALSVEDQGKVSKAGTLAEASKALADMMAQAFLEDMKQLAPALNARNIVFCHELIDSTEAALDKIPPSVREQVLDATKDSDGKNSQENFSSYRSALKSLCIHNTKMAAPAFVIESDGGTLVNDPVILPHITRLSCWATRKPGAEAPLPRTKDISVNTEPSPTRRTPPSRRQIRTATCWKFSWTSTAGLQASRSGFPRS